jgi:hypothetical protein
MKTKQTFSIVLLISGILGIGYLLLSHFRPLSLYPCGVSDTITYVDTIPFYLPIPKDSIVLRYETRRLPVRKGKADTPDSLQEIAQMPPSLCSLNHHSPVDYAQQSGNDSMDVVIPITQKVYEDVSYKAWVSGYEPRLDSIFVYQKTQVINHYIKEKKKCWGIGIQVGYGVVHGNPRPYIGLGMQYNILRW